MNNLKRIFTYLLLLTVMCVRTVQAQDSAKSITLGQAIDLSIQNSKLLKSNKARIDEATASVKEATEKKLPDFSVSGSYLFLPVKPDISLKSSGSGSGGSTPNINQAMYGMASASLPIYAGNKIQYGIESAKYLEQATRLDADHDKGSIIINTINAYSNLYKAKAAVELIKQNLLQSQQRVKDFTNLEKNGLLARNDLLKAELQSSNIELVLAEAEGNYKTASVNLSLMLGLPEQTLIEPDSASLVKSTTIKTVDDYEQLAFQNRKDLSALSFRKKAADVSIKTLKGDYYPGVALTAGYVALDVPKFVSVVNAVDIGVGIQYNLSSLWKTKTKIAEAKARSQELSANEEMLNDQIRMQINQSYQDYLVIQKKIEVYKVATEQANENYRITKNKYDNSLATTTDLLEADVAQLQARLNEVNATVDAVIAYDKLLQAAGVLTN